MWSDAEKQTFRSNAINYLSAQTNVAADSIIDLVTETFGVDENNGQLEELIRFRDWVTTQRFDFNVPAPHAATVTITTSANGGSVSVSMEIVLENQGTDKRMVQALNNGACVQAFIAAHSAIKRITEVARDMLPSQPLPETAKQPSQTNNAPQSGSWEKATGIVVKDDGGKRYHRIRVGKFTKYGAPVWPDVLISGNCSTYVNLAPGDYPFDKEVYISLTPEGKPKVTAIR